MPKTKNILLVEDDHYISRAYKEGLERACDVKVEVAENGQKALEIMRGTSPDLVLLDLILPIIDGVEVLRTMRADQGLKDVPVIVITVSSRGPEEIEEIEKLGVEDYLIKTENSMREIVEKIKKILERQV